MNNANSIKKVKNGGVLNIFYYLWTIYLHVKTNNNLNYNLKTINYYLHEKKFLFYVENHDVLCIDVYRFCRYCTSEYL